jgi:hypothetical protein
MLTEPDNDLLENSKLPILKPEYDLRKEFLFIWCLPGSTRVTYTYNDDNAKSPTEEELADQLRSIVDPTADKWSIATGYAWRGELATRCNKVGHRGLTSAQSDNDLRPLIERYKPTKNRIALVFVRKKDQSETQGLNQIGTFKDYNIYQPIKNTPSVTVSVREDYSLALSLKSFAIALLPFWMFLLTPLLSGVITRFFQDDRKKRIAYRCVAYSLTLLSPLVWFALKQDRYEAFVNNFLWFPVSGEFLVVCFFFTLLLTIVGETLRFPPVWTNDVVRSISSQYSFYMRSLYIGPTIGVLIATYINPSSFVMFPILFSQVFPFKLHLTESTNESILRIFKICSEHFGFKNVRVFVIEATVLRQLSCIFKNAPNCLFITTKGLFGLSEDEKLFRCAYACALNIQLSRASQIPVVIQSAYLGTIYLVFAGFGYFTTIGWLSLCFLSGIWLLVYLTAKKIVSRRINLECEAEALRYTKDLHAALSAVEKERPVDMNPKRYANHRLTNRRIENLKAVARELGLPETQPVAVT